jgi:hypothetical protein
MTNKKILLSHLFKAVGETLVDFGYTRLGGQIGFITMLHTWDQTLLDHFHLHCLVPAGALSYDQMRRTPARKNFLFPVKALSVVFCGKFLDLLKSAFAQNKLLFVGQTASLADPVAFKLLIKVLRKKLWIVYAKKPFGSPSMSSTTSAATPTAWRSPMIGFSQPITEKSPLVTKTEKMRTEKTP